jgi:hypothetical protein
MTDTTACAGCQKTIFKDKGLPIYLGTSIVGYVHNMPATSDKITQICIRQAFWRLREKNPSTVTIIVGGKMYNEGNTPSPSARRPSGSGSSAVRYAQHQRKGVAITHVYHHPSSSS